MKTETLDYTKNRIWKFFLKNREDIDEISSVSLDFLMDDFHRVDYELSYSVEKGFEHNIAITCIYEDPGPNKGCAEFQNSIPDDKDYSPLYATEHPMGTLDEAFREIEKQITERESK